MAASGHAHPHGHSADGEGRGPRIHDMMLRRRDERALIRLLQLASPTLPVGAYTYSQGLEWAVEAGTVKNEATALAWIRRLPDIRPGALRGRCPGAHAGGLGRGDMARLAELDAEFLASRETAELRAETAANGLFPVASVE